LATIQPFPLRAPEVILKAPWTQSADIWNLGAVVPELIYGQNISSGGDEADYTVAGHLAEINALLGPFPPHLIAETQTQEARELFDAGGNVREPKSQKVVSLAERFEDLAHGEGFKLEEFIRSLLALTLARRQVKRSKRPGSHMSIHRASRLSE
jgi:serine/threonine-protein kinase SRPK3